MTRGGGRGGRVKPTKKTPPKRASSGTTYTGDQIGARGERLLEDWATFGRFKVAKLDPDCLGVDRVFEIASDLDVSLFAAADSLPRALSGRIQVKTSTRGAPRDGVSLSNWKRFIDSDEPCFFIGIELTPDLQLRNALVLPVDETVIGIALKKMRGQSSVDGLSAELVPPWSHSKRIEGATIHDDLVREVRAHVLDPHTYAQRKRHWRETVGYDLGGKLRITMMVAGSSEVMKAAAFGDAAIPITVTSLKEVRFDIETPVADESLLGTALLRVEPTVIGGATLHVTSSVESESVSGELSVGRLPFPGAPTALRFKSGVLEARVVVEATGTQSEFAISHQGLANPSLSVLYEAALAVASVFDVIANDRSEARIAVDGRDFARADRASNGDVKELRQRLHAWSWARLPLLQSGVGLREHLYGALLEAQVRELALWAMYFAPSKLETFSLTIPNVRHESGPVAILTVPMFALLRGLIVQPLAFVDESPTRDEQGDLVIVPRPLSAGTARFVKLDDAHRFDPMPDVVELRGKLESRAELLEPDPHEVGESWASLVKVTKRELRRRTGSGKLLRRSS